MTDYLTHSERKTLPAADYDSIKYVKPYYAREIMPGTGFPAGYLKVFGPDHRERGALERSRALELVNELNAADAARANEEAEGEKLAGERWDGQ